MADRVNYKTKVDTTTLYKYIGEARPGAIDSADEWRIVRIDLCTDDVLWAESGEFQVSWDGRTTHTYS